MRPRIAAVETPTSITIQTATDTVTVRKADIEKRTPSNLSLMPDGLIQQLKPQEIRDLFKYLMSPGQVALPSPELLWGEDATDAAGPTDADGPD